MDDLELLAHLGGPFAAADDLRGTLAMTHAFVTVLLAEHPGPLTPVQRDLLHTIKERVSGVLRDDVERCQSVHLQQSRER